MADEKNREQNQPGDQDRAKAMGAGASAGQGRDNPDLNSQPSEVAGQGGGIQGSGQRQENPGGFTGNENRDEVHALEDSIGNRAEPQGE